MGPRRLDRDKLRLIHLAKRRFWIIAGVMDSAGLPS